MTLIRRRNGDFFPSLRSTFSDLLDVDRFFDDPIFTLPTFNGRRHLSVPATNVRDTDDEFVVELAAPGMKKSDFHVNMDKGLLEIKAEKEEKSEEEKTEYARREYDYSTFYRCFNLPESVNAEKIKAEYKDGILKVHLPKVPEAKRKPVKEIAVG